MQALQYLAILLLAADLTEAAQLELYKEADAYYASPRRDNARAVDLYRDVLESVDLAPPLRIEVLERIATMGRATGYKSGRKDEGAMREAAAALREIVAALPLTDSKALDARRMLADTLMALGDLKGAEIELREIVFIDRDLSDSERDALGPHRLGIVAGARSKLIYVCERMDGDDWEKQWAAFRRIALYDPQMRTAVLDYRERQLKLIARLRDREGAETYARIAQLAGASAEWRPARVDHAPSAVPPPDDAALDLADLETIRALKPEGGAGHDTDIYIVLARLRGAYPIPISIESPATNSAGSRTAIRFSVEKNESLAHSLDKLAAASRGLVRWEIVRGRLCVLPDDEAAGGAVSPLDALVSLHVEGVSAWEAIKAIAIEVNRQRAFPRPLAVFPGEWNIVERPLAALTEKKEITLAVDAVTAREAICAVLAASSLPLAYKYGDGGLTILTYENGRPRQKGNPNLTSDELDWWRKETAEIVAGGAPD